VKEHAANVIAENMLTQVDSEGFLATLMEAVAEHHNDDSVAATKSDQFVATKRGQKLMKKTAVGWKLLVRQKDVCGCL